MVRRRGKRLAEEPSKLIRYGTCAERYLMQSHDRKFLRVYQRTHICLHTVRGGIVGRRESVSL